MDDYIVDSLSTREKKFYVVRVLRDGSLSTQNQNKFSQKYREWIINLIIPYFNELFDLNLSESAVYVQQDRNRRHLIQEKFLIFTKEWAKWYIQYQK